MDRPQLIKACKKGKRAAQTELYERTADYIMNICYRYCPDVDEVKDIFQETYLKVFEHIKQYDTERGELHSWMARIAINTALARQKRAGRITFVEDFQPTLHPISDEDVIGDLSAEELQACVNRLPEGFRLVFNMYVVEGFSHKEIGQLLGITDATSRSQLSRARALLQKAILKQQKSPGHEATQ